MRKQFYRLGVLGATLATLLATGGSPVFALSTQPEATHTEKQTTTEKTTEESTHPEAKTDGHLTQAHLRACQNREKAVNNTTNRIITRGEKQLELFSTIAQRVETFKTTKNVTVANYDQLVATIQADHTKVANDLAAMKTHRTLDCTSSDPKGMVTAFQGDLKTEISDMKTYRTDVKNLTVAVKTAIGSTSTTSHDSKGGKQ